MGYAKSDVETHSEHFRERRPAVNVKSYHFPDAGQVVARFGCSEETAERALEIAFECQQEQFWEDVCSVAEDVFGSAYGHVNHKDRKVWQEGRSGGWLVVHDLPAGDVEDWDAIDLAHWRSFERRVKECVKWAEDWETVADLIEINEWAHDQSAMENVIAQALA